MNLALEEARKAYSEGEVPVGAVLIEENGKFFSDHNRTGQKGDPSAHAEHNVICLAAKARGDWRLENSILYTTLEPCLMCGGLAVLARVSRIVYGTRDRRFGAFGSVTDILKMSNLNHYPEVFGGILSSESEKLLRIFFRSVRIKNIELNK